MNLQPIVQQEKIKRPMNSFMLYRRDKQHEIANNNPGTNFRQVNKIAGEAWKHEAPEIKEAYARNAFEVQLAHKVKYPGYKYPSSISKKNRQKLSNGPVGISIYAADSLNNVNRQAFPYPRFSGTKKHPSPIALDTKNLGQTAAIPNSPKDHVTAFKQIPTLLSPIAFSFERDPSLNAFFNSWEYQEFAPRSITSKPAVNEKKYIASSLMAHLPRNGYSADL